jgi:hypothetical protein
MAVVNLFVAAAPSPKAEALVLKPLVGALSPAMPAVAPLPTAVENWLKARTVAPPP